MAPIHIAVMRNSVPGVKVLLGHEDIDLNCQNDAGETPLFIACRDNHVEVVKLLLESSKVDVNMGSPTPLFIASTHGSYETCQLIVTRDDIKEDIRTAEGVSPLMAAAQRGDFKMVNILYNSVKRLPLESRRLEITDATFIAIQQSNTDIVGLLSLDEALDTARFDSNGETLLTAAVKTSNKKLVNKFLLLKDKGLDVNQPNRSGKTPYDIALELKDTAICSVLETSGARFPYDSQ